MYDDDWFDVVFVGPWISTRESRRDFDFLICVQGVQIESKLVFFRQPTYVSELLSPQQAKRCISCGLAFHFPSSRGRGAGAR